MSTDSEAAIPTEDQGGLSPSSVGAAGTPNSGKSKSAPFGKLFVGQVPAVCTEEMLLPLFAPYGTIVEIKIMKDSHGRSKGCAWVRYETQAQAQLAIEALHEKHAIPPQTNMLQVRYANSSGSKSGGGGGGGGRSNQSHGGGDSQFSINQGGSMGGMQNQFNPAMFNAGQFGMNAGYGLQNQWGGQAFGGANGFGGMNQWGGQAMGAQGGFDYGAAGWGAQGGAGSPPKMKKSPPGMSVFVGNLPPAVQISDIKSLFQTTLPSVQIMTCNIHRDRRFGFVTFATPEDAAAAATNMNGQLLGENKIRVEVTQNEPRYGGANRSPGMYPAQGGHVPPMEGM